MAKAQKRDKLPQWCTDYFTAALDRHKLLVDSINASSAGVSVTRAMPNAIRVLEKHQPSDDPSKLHRAEEFAKFAEEEIERGFSTINGFGTLAIWSWLEAFVTDFCVIWIRRRPSALKEMDGPKIKVDLGEYARLTNEDRARFVVEALDREFSGPLKRGPARFENLLSGVGVPILLDKKTKKNLFELQSYRNCLAHRFGIVDRKLKDDCPWLNERVGAALTISMTDFFRFSNSAAAVLLATIHSAGDTYDLELREESEPTEKGPTYPDESRQTPARDPD